MKVKRWPCLLHIWSDTVVVGAPFEDSNAIGVNGESTDDSGAAYVFARRGTNWSQEASLKASNTDAADNFGSSVAVAGDSMFVGAPREDSNAIGVNGDESNNSVNSGAAYAFTRQEAGPRLALLPDGTGGYFVRFRGIPGDTFRLQRSPDASSPWDTISTLSVPASGSIEYHDAPAPTGQAFYRTVKP